MVEGRSKRGRFGRPCAACASQPVFIASFPPSTSGIDRPPFSLAGKNEIQVDLLNMYSQVAVGLFRHQGVEPSHALRRAGWEQGVPGIH